MDDLYRDYILEHYRRPHNFGVIEDADASYEAWHSNSDAEASCGSSALQAAGRCG